MGKHFILAVLSLQLHCALLVGAQHPPPTFDWAGAGTGSAEPWKVRLDATGNAVISGSLYTNLTVGSITFTNESSNGFALVVDPNGVPISGFQTIGSGSVQLFSIPLPVGGFAYFGSLSGTVTMGSITRTKTSAGGENAFHAFTDDQGAVTSFEFADGNGHFDNFMDASVTPERDVIAGGQFTSDSLQFGSNTLTNAVPENGYDLMLVKFSSTGQPLWARSYPASNDQFVDRLVVHSDGSIFISGHFGGDLVQTFQLGNVTLTNGGGYDVFVAKLGAAGEPIWARSFHQGDSDFSSGLAVSQTGDVFSTATLNFQTVQLDKYDASGQLLWQFATPTNITATAYSVHVGFDGEAYICGSHDGYAAIWKINDQGNLVWLKLVEGPRPHWFVDLAIDQTGPLTAFGSFSGDEVQLDGITLAAQDRPLGNSSPFFARLSADPPALRQHRFGTDLVLSWPTNQPSFQLEANQLSLLPEAWQTIPFTIRNSRFESTNSPIGPGRVFRLRKNE